MKKLLKLLVLTVIGLAALGHGATKLWPQKAASLIKAAALGFAGLEERQVMTETGLVQYLEGGSGETILFLHGIYARKEHWIDLSRHVSDRYRVILLDLPGFGDNPVLGPGNYDYERQSKHLLQVIEAMGLERFHLAANSMSAQTAATLALKRPEQVSTLAFIGSPVGVASPVPSDMERALATGITPLVVSDMEDYQARMAWLFPEVPYIPGPLNQSWAMAEVARADENHRIWDEVAASSARPLLELAPQITQPALIVWCRQDRIFHHSGGPVLEEALSDAKLVLLDQCGHLPMLDSPTETASAYLAFLERH